MNIFFLDKTPEKSAKYLCDKHVPKMLLESAQMLSTAIHSHTWTSTYNMEISTGIYKEAYPNHPMTKWVGFNRGTFNWALRNALYIGAEYSKRFGKIHKSMNVINAIYDNNYMDDIPDGLFKEPPQCMPDEYKDTDYVTAYRRYYNTDKKYFAKWKRGRQQPYWWQ